MRILCKLMVVLMLLLNCKEVNDASESNASIEQDLKAQSQIDSEGKTISERFNTPEGFTRVELDSNSFGSYLRNLPLKEVEEKVKYFDGRTKNKSDVYEAVVDLPIGKRDLHQCADAVIRLRAEFFYKQKKYDSIQFNFTNGFRADYSNWRKGKRISVNGNNVRWNDSGQASDAYQNFWKYLEMVFSYAGTASLEKEMKPIAIKELKIGAVFIKGGFPGHAVIVVDMAKNEAGEKVFLLAQSYMPAQEIQVLKNPNSSELTPWYSSEISNELQTPEWTFKESDLKKF